MMCVISWVLGIILIGFSCSAARDIQFPEVAGWKRSEDVQTFVPKTLYEYINGAADLYLACDFEELKVVEYADGNKAQVTVEVYRHKSSLHAFSIYSQERIPESNFISVGTQGYLDKNILNFLAGSYYVKISSYNTGIEDPDVLKGFADKVAENLEEKGGLPPVLSAFPAEGKRKNAEKMITKNFLGYSFMPPAFHAEYEFSGKKFKLFLIEAGGRNDCKVFLQKYLQQIKKPDQEVSEGRHTLTDPHHGIIDLCWKGSDIWGVLELEDEKLRSRYLNLFEDGLKGIRFRHSHLHSY